MIKFRWPEQIAESWRSEVMKHFPDSCATALEYAVSPEEVHAKDRHVVQAALRTGAEVIVTFNLKDFPSAALERVNIVARHPSEFLLSLFSIEPLMVARRLNEIAEMKEESLRDVLERLRRDVPAFVDHFASSVGMVFE